jgi:hypothetical protein
MKIILFACLAVLGCSAFAQASDIRIPERDVDLIKGTDLVEVSGTNDLGGAENFSIHDRKAIAQFIDLLTSERFTAAPKSLKPRFKSLSSYQVRLSAQGAPVLELRVIADSILDIPGDPMFYVESDHYSENLMAPLLRLR